MGTTPYNAIAVNESKELSQDWIYIIMDKQTENKLDSVRMINETDLTYLVKSLDSGNKIRYYKAEFFQKNLVLETIKPRTKQ